jgi:hypothetical protein
MTSTRHPALRDPAAPRLAARLAVSRAPVVRGLNPATNDNAEPLPCTGCNGLRTLSSGAVCPDCRGDGHERCSVCRDELATVPLTRRCAGGLGQFGVCAACNVVADAAAEHGLDRIAEVLTKALPREERPTVRVTAVTHWADALDAVLDLLAEQRFGGGQ